MGVLRFRWDGRRHPQRGFGGGQEQLLQLSRRARRPGPCLSPVLSAADRGGSRFEGAIDIFLYDRQVRLVLASASPRRADLLRAAGFIFETLPVDVDETVRRGEAAGAYVRRLAVAKAAE